MKKTIAVLAILASACAASAATSKRVVFESHGHRLVGDLYLPDEYQPGDRLPAVIVTGAWTTVKEQMPRRHAIEMADRGYAALAFDFRNWGQSEGEQRQLEDPELKTQDIIAAAEFLASLPEVDPGRIGGLGVCASAGYMADATARSERIRSVALVAPWFHNEEIVDAVYGGRETVDSLIATSRDADQAFEDTGTVVSVPAAGESGSNAIMQGAPYYIDRDRGLIPEYVNRFNLASWEPWLTYDSVAIADKLAGTPVHIVHSEAAAIPQGARAFFERLGGSSKSESWLDDVTQFDFYDDESAIAQWGETVEEFFTESLGVPERPTREATPAIRGAPGIHQEDIDRAMLITIVESVATLADRGNFTDLEQLFHDRVFVDYSSLSGQPGDITSPRELMAEWAGLLPGFDGTRHAISNVDVKLDGDNARATADVGASHWVDGLFWHADGRYSYEFSRDIDEWAITSMTFTLTEERGTREVFEAALEAARRDPAPYLDRD